MQQYMETLLIKINYPKEKYDNFKNAKIDKIVGNHDKTKYIFYIIIDSMLSAFDYLEFMDLLEKSYDELLSIEALFTVLNKKDSDIKDYYKILIKKIADASKLIEGLADLKIEVTDNNLVISALNLAQQLRIDDIKDKLSLLYKKIGYEVNISVNIIDDNKIRKEIENDLKIDVPKEL